MQISEKNTTESKAAYEKMKRWYRSLPDKKRYLEFVTALLTIPVLLTVLLNNISNIRKQQPLPTPTAYITPTGSPTQRIIQTSPSTTAHGNTPSDTPTPYFECKKEIGPIDISYPDEHETLTENPICLDITRQKSQYCSVVWSYRINAGSWSNYTDKEICMYGLTPGEKQLELRVKSIVTGDEIILKRTFTVAGNPSPTPATQSSQLQ